MIPKIIHYCWFGRNPLPASALKCIDSWKKFFPDYEIKEWNEDNFDVNILPYTQAAYAAKKYAFVSDYARFWVLYKYGGLYFDTDVEVIAPFDDILDKGGFMGCEIDQTESYAVAPGLGLGVMPQSLLCREILEVYEGLPFFTENQQVNPYAVVRITTDVLLKHGLQPKKGIQTVEGITVYPAEYFNPLDDATGRLKVTKNTRSIHWFAKTWVDNHSPLRTKLTRLARRLLGSRTLSFLKHILRKA